MALGAVAPPWLAATRLAAPTAPVASVISEPRRAEGPPGLRGLRHGAGLVAGLAAAACLGAARARRGPLWPSASARRVGVARRGGRELYRAGPCLGTGTLDVGDGYELYYEEHGNAVGIPVVFLHGGPGAGASRKMAQLFDPEQYRVIIYDQRGCGKSKRKGGAAAQLEVNTTWHHVEDMEKLREHLNVDQWVVSGGSWGTCLSLAYASRHKERVLGMILRAVCLFRDEEFDFFLGPGHGARTSIPDKWTQLTGWMRDEDLESAHSIARAFQRAALGQDESLSPENAMYRWASWEFSLMSAKPPELDVLSWSLGVEPGLETAPPKAPEKPWEELGNHRTQALLTVHYVAERGFFPPGFSLVEEARAMPFPIRMVHGLNDCVCPVQNARDIASAAPDAELVATTGGHSQWDSANIDAWVSLSDEMAAAVVFEPVA